MPKARKSKSKTGRRAYGHDAGRAPRFVSAEIRTFGATGETFARVAWIDEHGRRVEALGPRASADMRALLAAAMQQGVRPKHVVKPAYGVAPMPAYARGRVRVTGGIGAGTCSRSQCDKPSKIGWCKSCRGKRLAAFRRIEREHLVVGQAGGLWWIWDQNGNVLVSGKHDYEDAIGELAFG